MKKIVHLIHLDHQKDKTNLFHVVDSLAKSQHEMGERVEVWTISSFPQQEPSRETYSSKSFTPHWSRFTLSAALIEELNAHSCTTVFHFHGKFIPEFYTIAKRLKSKGIPYVVTPLGIQAQRSFPKTLHFDHIEQFVLQNAVFIHCKIEEEIHIIQRMGNFKRFQLIPQGHHVSTFQMGTQKPTFVEGPVFGFCGSALRDQRSVDLLLNAFRLYKCEWQGKGKLWLIAEENSIDYLSRSANMCEIKEDVAFFAGTNNHDKRHLMSQLDAFYQPSCHEEAPLHVVEAAAMGKAVVVSEQTNMTPYVSAYMAGICLLKNTPEEIAKSMKKVADLKKIGLLDKLGTSARRMVEDHFDWKIIGKRMVEAYERNWELAGI